VARGSSQVLADAAWCADCTCLGHRCADHAAESARSLHEICEAAGLANCGECWQAPGTPCAHSETGAEGYHVARFGRAQRRGLISGPDLIAVLSKLVVFTSATVVYDIPGGAS
jgi:hypothetical protein